MQQSASTPDPTNPTDTPLVAVVDAVDDALARDDGGPEGQFRSEEGARIRCLTCRDELDAASIVADDVTRLEGVSDPADMTMVVPVRCPHCDASGSLVLGYGPDATPEDSDVLRALRRRPTP